MTPPTSDLRTDQAIEWLLGSDEPGVRMMTRPDLLGESVSAEDAAEVMVGPKVRALISGQLPDGGFGARPYSKWSGAHWRLVSLVELGVPPCEPKLLAAAETVLDWLTGEEHRGEIQTIDGLPRCHASQEGNALVVACRLGMAGDPRVELLARSLVEWQWPDGGWNCDVYASGDRSSFHESLIPAWGLHEYHAATGSQWARDATLKTADLFLEHRLFRSLKTGGTIDSNWLKLRFPPYWHYGILYALMFLARLDRVSDPRAADALERLRDKRLADGRWPAEGKWYKTDIVDWGGSGPNEMITLNALRVLAGAGEIDLP